MDTMTFCVPCLFGLEGLVGDELRRLDLQNVRVEDRRVFFEGDFAAMAKANLCCRMGERVMILLAEFDAHSFEDLFQGVKAVPLERFIPKNGAFPVKGYSLNSQLHSVPDCQAIVKKAAVTRLGEKYGLGWLPETRFADGIGQTIDWYLANRPWWEEIVSGEYQTYYARMYGDRPMAGGTSSGTRSAAREPSASRRR